MRPRHIATTVLSAAVLSLTIVGGGAVADTQPSGSTVPSGTIIGSSRVVSAQQGDVVLAPAPGVSAKDFHPEKDMLKDLRLLALVPGWHPMLTLPNGDTPPPSTQVHPNLSETDHLSKSWSGPQRPAGTGYESFAADCTDTIDVTSDGIGCTGSAYASYSASASNISLTTSLTINGLSVSFQYPFGVGVSVSGNTLSDTTTSGGNTVFSAINMHGTGFYVLSVDMSVQAKEQVGSGGYQFPSVSDSGGY